MTYQLNQLKLFKHYKMANKNIGRARILQERKNMERDKVDYLHAQPLETDLYTWHFTFRGPENTDFHEGLYHGQIILPFEYPFKPPDIIFSNKNGRFEVNTKICLTITQYHTQQWNSAWTIRTMLEAVISLFNERVVGHGYLESSGQARRFLAKASHQYTCEKCGKISQVIKPREPISKNKQSKVEEAQGQQLRPEEQKMIYSQMQKEKEKQRPKKQKQKQQSKQAEPKKIVNNLNSEAKKQKPKVIPIKRQKLQKTTKKKQKKQLSPHELFYQCLLNQNQVYLNVINSKKLIQQ